jgi:SAM-dependent methyltransferase
MALPVPPPELWEGWGDTPESYLDSGQADVAAMESVLHAAGFALSEHGRILDFGCAAGRMLRWCPPCDEAWGVDVSAPHIAWCRQNLSPPFSFAVTTTEPRLPFEERHFDLVYAASVFTHIAVGADAWILELRRILAPGGLAYVTIHDETSLALLRRMPDHWVTRLIVAERGSLAGSFDSFVVGGSDPKHAVVFHGLDWLTRKWQAWFRVVSVTPEAYYYQTALLLQKPVESP